jgi:hypothetical protein
MEFDYIIFDSLNLFGYGSGQRDEEFIPSRGLRPKWNDGIKDSILSAFAEYHGHARDRCQDKSNRDM